MAAIESLFLSVAGSYIETEIVEFVSTDVDVLEKYFSGQPFNYATKVQYRSSACLPYCRQSHEVF